MNHKHCVEVGTYTEMFMIHSATLDNYVRCILPSHLSPLPCCCIWTCSWCCCCIRGEPVCLSGSEDITIGMKVLPFAAEEWEVTSMLTCEIKMPIPFTSNSSTSSWGKWDVTLDQIRSMCFTTIFFILMSTSTCLSGKLERVSKLLLGAELPGYLPRKRKKSSASSGKL